MLNKGNDEIEPTMVDVVACGDITTNTASTAAINCDGDSISPKLLIGKDVKTMFGRGIVMDYRVEDEMYIIKMTNNENSFAAPAVLYTPHVPTQLQSQVDTVDALNVAYEALEKMRRMNLEVQCHELGIYEQIDFDYCTTCLLSHRTGKSKNHFPRLQKLVDHASSTDFENFPRLQRMFHHSSTSPTSTSTLAAPNEGVTQGIEDNGVNNGCSSQDQVPTSSDKPQEESSHTAEQNDISVATDPSSLSNSLTRQEVTERTMRSSTQNENMELSSSAAPAPVQTATDRTDSTASTEAASFPRLRGLWSSIQSMPQPPAAKSRATNKSSPTDRSAHATSGTEGSTQPSKSLTSFPRIRGLVESSGASNMFNSMKLSTTVDARSPTSSSTSSPGKSEKPIALPRIQKMIDQRQKANTFPCLICASPSCTAHSSANFRKEGITLCLNCEKLFELDFIVDCVSAPDPTERAKNIDHMIDCYDRCMLLLQYSSQFVEQIATSLEQQKERQNKVGLASSSVGVLSGVLGIAAAATILTPAGPPLLIASLFFGGGATTVQTGTEAMNYFSEPRKLADRVIALHGMALSILRVTSTLRDAMMRDFIRTDVYVAEPTPLKEQVQEKLEKNRTAVLAGSNVGRTVALSSMASAEAGAGVGAIAAGTAGEMGAMAGTAGARSATAFSRAGTAAARTMRFARFAGGALSAAILVMEANAIQSTLKSIHEGNPCDKADRLRWVVQEAKDFPTTKELDDECQAYLEALANRPPPATEVCAVSDESNVQDIPEAPIQGVADDGQLFAGAIIVEGAPSEADTHEGPRAGEVQFRATASASSSSLLGGSSLIQRFQHRREERQHMAMSRTEEVVAVAVDDSQLEESGLDLVV